MVQFATHCGGGNASCRHGDLQTVRSLWHFFYVCSYDSTRLQTLGLGHVTVCNSLWWWECFLPPRWLANRKVTLALLLRLQLRFNETSNSGSGSRYSLQLTVVVGSVREENPPSSLWLANHKVTLALWLFDLFDSILLQLLLRRYDSKRLDFTRNFNSGSCYSLQLTVVVGSVSWLTLLTITVTCKP